MTKTMGDAEIEGGMRLRGLRLFLGGGDERNEGFWLSELALCKSPARAPGVALNRLRQKEAAGGC